MDENTNTTLFIIVGVIILALIVVAFNTKMPDLISGASDEMVNVYQTQ